MTRPIRPQPEHDAETVRAISVAVYKRRLGEYDTARMIADDGGDEAKLAERAGSLDILTRAYLAVITARIGVVV